MNTMNTIQTLVLSMAMLLAAFLPGDLLAQSAETPKKSHRWAVYGGLGPNIYLNNLEIAADRVKPLNYTFVARLMWEPEYFLSLGVETGYNQLYTMSGSHPATGDVRIVNAVVPLQGVISMRFSEHFYGNFNLGFGILLNNVSTGLLGDFDASVMSMGDFTAALGYRKNMTDRFTLGGELRGYYSGKLQDRNVALVVVAGYKIW
jgi:hypothetical protein